jgi:hypothetical protein
MTENHQPVSVPPAYLPAPASYPPTGLPEDFPEVSRPASQGETAPGTPGQKPGAYGTVPAGRGTADAAKDQAADLGHAGIQAGSSGRVPTEILLPPDWPKWRGNRDELALRG